MNLEKWPKIITERLILQLPELGCAKLMCDFVVKNKTHLSCWEPVQSDIFYTESYWKEKIVMLNLITTNETFFFREIEHFEFCQKTILPQHPFKTKFRAWSAASSVGAEAYSLAMLLDTAFARSDWEVVGTDINTDVIEKANIALYPEAWLEKIPKELRKKYCLKGKGKHEGKFMIDKVLKENIHFFAKNLLMPISDIGKFDLIFLRNILIYFDEKTKQRVVDNIIFNLKPNGNGGFSTDIKFSDVQEVVVDVTPGVMKMFELHNKNDTHVAAITTGVAELDGRSMGDLSHEFFEKQKAMAKPRANVKVVASDFYKFIRGKYLEIYPEGPNQFKPWLEFLIGGYGKKDRFPRLYRVYVHEDKILKVHSDGSGGTAWGGQSTAVEGFLNGVANQMKNSIEFQYAESIKSLQQGFVNSLVDYETKTGTKIAINDL
ncbi:MAG: hypothetical protein JKX98_08260, partial [Alcanivoracaceae bacterium]|nr:hypothetical protein [Alcanivoracaceae bacterium]